MRTRNDGKIYIVFAKLGGSTAANRVSSPLYASAQSSVTSSGRRPFSIQYWAMPGDGLVIEGHGFALDLNGFSISGSWGGFGVRLTPSCLRLHPQGPGMISISGPGIVRRMGTGGITIQEVTFCRQYCWHRSQPITGADSILENTIRGGGSQRAPWAISLGEMHGTIEETQLRGHPQPVSCCSRGLVRL